MARYVLSMSHPAFFYTDRFRLHLHVMEFFFYKIIRLCNMFLLSILLFEIWMCIRVRNMLSHFSFSILNKPACRVLKWLAIETIDEQLFLPAARTGKFQTENLHFRCKTALSFRFRSGLSIFKSID